MKKLIFCLMFWCCFTHAESCFKMDMSMAQITQCANKGDVMAQFNLGWKYYSTDKDYKKAFEWFLKAAEHGHAEAQYNVGVMYGNGEGAPQNDKKALEWYVQSAEKGNVDAQYNLAVRYHEGKSLPQNKILTYMWINLAAMQGKPEAIQNRKNIAQVMTLDEITKGQQMSADWLAKHPQK